MWMRIAGFEKGFQKSFLGVAKPQSTWWELFELSGKEKLSYSSPVCVQTIFPR
jgi:hypothetical protein